MSAESPTLPSGVHGFAPGARRAGRLPRWVCIAGIAAAVVAGAFLLDTPLSRWVAEVAAPGTWLRRTLKLPVHVLKQWAWFVALAVALAAQPRPWQRLRPYLMVLVVGFGLLYLLKYAVGRARPDLDLGVYSFAPWADRMVLSDGFDSMPSGHAFSFILLATLLSHYVPRSRWVVWPLAVLGSVSRVALQRHFVSDVLAGAALALLVVEMARYRAPAAFRPLAWRSIAARLPRFGAQLRLLGRGIRAAARRAPTPANGRSSS